MIEVSILSTSSKKPSRIVDNAELEKKMNLRAGIIERLTGIRERHYLGPGETLQELATDVCQEAINSSELNPSEIDMMIFYTDVPPTLPEEGRLKRIYYEVSAHIQYLLRMRGVEINCECINIGGSCVSFISAMRIAYGLIKSQLKKNILIFGATNNSIFIEKADKNTIMTFSDGAAATILSRAKEKGFVDFYCMTDGAGYDSGYYEDYERLILDRKKIAEFAPRAFQLALNGLLKKARLMLDDVDLFIPHQAGIRIIKKGMELSGIPSKKVYLCLQNEGNTGATALQSALSNALKESWISDGDLIVLVGFGTGWNYGATAFYYRKNQIS